MIHKFFHHRWHLAVRTMIIVAGILMIKYGAHVVHFDPLTLNSLFSALVSSTIFLIGFLVSGTLADYKESERLPSEVAASVETILDDGLILIKKEKQADATAYLGDVRALCTGLLDWFHHEVPTEVVMEHIRKLNVHFVRFEEYMPANFIVRLKQEQHLLRKNIMRIHVIRSTRFLSAGYAIAEIISLLLIIALIFVNFEPFFENLFFTGFISFIVCYMILFIRELDNPFDYTNEHRLIEEVSIQPIIDSKKRVDEALSE